jgi:dsDNA-binding SOS-regulon protein
VVQNLLTIVKLLKERYKGREDEEEEASSYWMALRKREVTEILNRKD